MTTLRNSASTGTSWGLWSTAGFGLIITAVFILMQIFVAVVFVMVDLNNHPGLLRENYADSLVSNGFYLAWATCATALAGSGLIVLFIRLRKQLTVKEYLGINPINLKTLMQWLGAAFVFVLASEGLTYLLTELLGKPMQSDFMFDIYRTAYFAPLLWFALIIAAPLFEELFFRGFLFTGIRHSWLGPVGAVLLTSLAWALIHAQYNLYEQSTIFVLGLLLGVARLKTQSIYVTIAMHALLNLLATVQTAMYLPPIETGM